MSVPVALSHGIWRDGQPLLDAELRELAGTDEELLSRLPDEIPIAARVSELLALTVVRIGGVEAVSIAETRELSIGDRERLLLHLCAENFGRKLRCQAHCVQCGEQVDGQVSIDELLVEPTADPRAAYELSAKGGQLRFRLPRGGDQELVAPVVNRDLDEACELLVERCLIDAGEDLDPRSVRETLEEKFADLDPQAETLVQLICPSCESTTEIFLDASTLVFERIAGAGRLLDEVDSIARSYHWSEREILALSTARRRAYLRRIADEAIAG